MAMNVNKINQNNDYNIKNAKVGTEYSALRMANTIQGTGKMGLLLPAHVQEMLPSQKITLKQDIGIQFNPFVSNLFHEINGEMLTYFVPNRIIWDEWETYITGGIDGQDETAHPTMSLKELYEATSANPEERTLIGTLADYFGMPISWDFSGEEETATKPIAFLWWAYNKIYNDHIRIIDVEDVEIDKNNNEVLRGNYDWDYFTRARIYQQRGVIPSVPVSDELQQLEHQFIAEAANVIRRDNSTALKIYNADTNTQAGNAPLYSNLGILKNDTGVQAFSIDPNGGLKVPTDGLGLQAHNLESLGMNMNDFVIALGIMRLQINNAKIQPRYIDQLAMRFDVYPQDARLQRPEYLGSNYFNISTDTVTQTAPAVGGSTPQGNITGQAWGNGQNMMSTYEAKEHGLLMTIFIIRPKSVYEGGLNKKWVKKTRFDYATPELANLPDVEIKQGELIYTGTAAQDEKLFGWQGIYEEYRTLNNMVTGRLRPSISDNLKSFTLARYWTTAGYPALNKEFIQCEPDENRILQYQDEPTFIYFIRNEVATAIPLPIQSEPGDLSFI